MIKERHSWIDIARGIGIILVIYGHTLGSNGFRYLIYAFHMPLFFFLSGLVFHSRKNEPYLNSLKKDLKRILIPYFIFSFISLFLWFINLSAKDQTISNVLKQILGIIYGNANYGFLAINTVLWFLPCLFITKQLFWLISRYNKLKISLFLFAFSIIGYLFSLYFPNIKLPYGIEIALNGVVFFGIGYLWNHLNDKINSFFSNYGKYLIGFLILITIFLATINFQNFGFQIDLRLNKLSNYFIFYIAAFSGILATILISKNLNKNIVLEYLGKNSMVLFVWHYFAFMYISKLFFVIVKSDEIIKIRNIYYSPIYTFSAIAILLFINKLFNEARFKFLKVPVQN